MLIYTHREKNGRGFPEASIHNMDTGLTYLLEVCEAHSMPDPTAPHLSLTICRAGSSLEQDFGFVPSYFGQEAFDFWNALLSMRFADRTPIVDKFDWLGVMWAVAVKAALDRAVVPAMVDGTTDDDEWGNPDSWGLI